MPASVQIRGFDELIKALQDAPEIARPIIGRAMENSLDVVIGRLKDEPPSTDANKPGRWKEVKSKSGTVSLRAVGFYERHMGYWYPIMKRETLGQGKALKSEGRMTARRARGMYGMAGKGAVAGYKLSKKRSEFLTQKWSREIIWDTASVMGVLRNSASYAKYVEGPVETQSKLMAKIGWPALDNVLVESTPSIMEFFERARNELVAALARRAS